MSVRVLLQALLLLVLLLVVEVDVTPRCATPWCGTARRVMKRVGRTEQPPPSSWQSWREEDSATMMMMMMMLMVVMLMILRETLPEKVVPRDVLVLLWCEDDEWDVPRIRTVLMLMV